MKNTLYLTKVLFLNSFGLNFSNKAKKNKKSISRIGYIALIIFLILFVGAPMLLMGIGMGVSFNEIGKTLEGVNVVLEGFKSFLPLMSIMILFFSIFNISFALLNWKKSRTNIGLICKSYKGTGFCNVTYLSTYSFILSTNNHHFLHLQFESP